MGCLLGVDLGTSSLKSLLMREDGEVLAVSQKEYGIDIPMEGWAEQDPEVWWSAAADTIRGVLFKAGVPAGEIRGVGLSGQMHGLVALSREGKLLRPAILWCDRRSAPQKEEILKTLGEEFCEITCNPPAVGFQAMSLLWMKKHEPGKFGQIHTLLLPKDYLRYRLTGELSTDVTDASGTLAYDVRKEEWSRRLISLLGLPGDAYPKAYLPADPAGAVTESAARETGLAPGTPVVHGGADQVMQAIGNGILQPGQVSVTIGTGGQVLAPLSAPVYDKRRRAHTFHFYREKSWFFLGATLSAGLSLRWLRDQILRGGSYREMDRQAQAVPPGSGGLIFLPYLSGERTPYMDAAARGMFFGLSLGHGRGNLIRAVMEGVTFSLKDCLTVLGELGETPASVTASGGGASSSVWLQMQADIFECEVRTVTAKEQAALGAAITAGVGTKVYASFREACAQTVRLNERVYTPDPVHRERYRTIYGLYRELYAATNPLMHRLGPNQ